MKNTLIPRASVTVEPLEPRTLMSWPNAPLLPPVLKDTIYVNQMGYARVNGQSLKSINDVNAYELYYDDAGLTTYQTVGAAHTQIAYYCRDGQPQSVAGDKGVAGPARLSVESNEHKPTEYLAVKLRDTRGGGMYDLVVNGVPQSYVGLLTPTAGANQADTRLAEISNANDTDFYSFVVTTGGNWGIEVDPVTTLDATLNVFDSTGKPIGGTFTAPIDRGDAGKPETWAGRNLQKGDQIVFRVDSATDSSGWYNIRVFRKPSVTVTIVDKIASEPGSNTAKFKFVRSRGSGISQALTVQYSLAGGARNGVDYQQLPGSVTFLPNQSVAYVVVKPLADTLVERRESVILRLQPAERYNLALSKGAIALIMDHPPASGAAASMGRAVAGQAWPFATATASATSFATPPASGIVGDDVDRPVWSQANEHPNSHARKASTDLHGIQ